MSGKEKSWEASGSLYWLENGFRHAAIAQTVGRVDFD
jgi:hypothetical protein